MRSSMVPLRYSQFFCQKNMVWSKYTFSHNFKSNEPLEYLIMSFLIVYNISILFPSNYYFVLAIKSFIWTSTKAVHLAAFHVKNGSSK